MMDERTDGSQPNLRKHPSYGVSTGKHPAQPPPPETIALILLQGMETSHPSQHHDDHTSKNDMGWDRRL